MQSPLADTFLGLTNPQLALIIAGIALLFSVIRWRKNMIDKQRNPSPDPPPSRAGSYSAGRHDNPLNIHEITSEIHALVTDLEETARRVTAQIDNRYTRLEQLLAEADEKILRLEAALNAVPLPASVPSANPEKSPVPPALVSDAQRTLARLRSDRGALPAQDPAYQPIYTLADRGKNAREIAQELQRHQGEIELILALRPRSPAPDVHSYCVG